MFRKIKSTTTVLLISFLIIFLMHSLGVWGYECIEEVDLPEILVEESINEVVVEIFDGIGTGDFIRPVDGIFTSGYGQRWGRLHGGIDIANAIGTPIVAADDGNVIFTGDCGTYGLLVKIDHKNGYVTYYAHCSEIKVSVGDLVKKGDIIALVGNTGNSTGPHCHFEIRFDNVQKNPLDFVKLEKAVS